MSSFAAKRKARVIKVADDGEAEGASAPTETGSAGEGKHRDRGLQPGLMSSRLTWTRTEPLKQSSGAKFARKPFRQSGLRKSFNPADDDTPSTGGDEAKDDEDDGPVVVRPSIGRAGSKHKKKIPKPRISFGGDAGDAENGDAEEPSMPKKAPLGLKAMENSAAKRGVPLRGLPTRSLHDDDDRPKYSKEYLSELQSSTPNTPRDISTLHIGDADEMELDASELEGALVVDSPVPSPQPTTQILSEAEIREKKERRARLAKEQGFLSVEDDDEEDRFGKKKDDTRLQREDEDLGEGFDEYVEDGGLSLGKRATKERRKKERQQMAELISAAEGHTSDSSSDSDAERRIAYESAQTRAGLDGLKKPTKNATDDLLKVPPKITPLPSLTECIAKLQASLKSMEQDIKTKNARVEQLRKEKQEIMAREAEVQALLDETGRKYQAAMGKGTTEAAPTAAGTTQAALELGGERGLESLGTTPQRADQEDVDML
ncbi:hypothetical protein PCL_09750 [Purpureocillium lilacinum]|uniref:Nineteen complex-related protein 2 domain-containing protein n=1 Tax=Purpureocillium lilacinum TaxID=33203 RepID=A0A2U3EDZ2_PURLI|nr:hypothetical protein PCL_09750 [Purpureocillium lilacinum]